MDIMQTYGKLILDIGFIALFLFILFTHLKLPRLRGILKGMIFLVVMWFLAERVELQMAETLLGYLVQVSFLILIVLFPNDFRTALESLGRKRMFNGNTQRLIRKESREQLARAVVHLARKRHGAIIVIARESGLEEEVVSGDFIGEMYIRKPLIEMLAHPDNPLHKGAIIIKDDKIIAANATLPTIEHKQLESVGAGKRHLAGLGVVVENDCMTIVVSGETGAITLVGKLKGKLSVDFALPLKDNDIVEGIDEEFIMQRIEDYLKGQTSVKKPPASPKKRSKGERKVEGAET